MTGRLLLLVLLATPAGADAISFVYPMTGAPVAGSQWIELGAHAPFDRIEIRVDGALAGVLREPPLRVRFDFGDGLKVRTVRADLWADDYRTHAFAEVTTGIFDLGEAMTVDWVEVAVRVRGRIAADPSAFRVFENGVEHEVVEVAASRGPARFVFVVDRSQSMGEGRLEAALRSIRGVLPRLRNEDRAEVVFFNHRVNDAIAVNEVGEVHPSGGTALRDALASIAPASRTIAIVVSDGDDRNSVLDRESALRRVAVENLTVHAIALGGGDGTSFLRDVAERTGGRFIRRDASRLDRALEEIFDEIDGRWTVAYQSAGKAAGWRAIRVETTARGTRVDAARKGYFAE